MEASLALARARQLFPDNGACTEDLAFGCDKEARYMKRNEAYGEER